MPALFRSLLRPQLFRSAAATRLWGISILAISLLLAGCSLFPTNTVSQCTEAGVIFVDTFEENENCGWYLYDDESLSGSATITNGVLEISSSNQGEFWWTNPQIDSTDMIIAATSRQVAGPDDNAYGVLCRYQNENNYYVFLISGDGYYAIGKFQTGLNEIQYLSGQGEYQFSEVIRQGNVENDIQVECVGNELTLVVNGVRLETVTDDSFPTGNIGMGVTTFQEGGAVVQFDNVEVYEP